MLWHLCQLLKAQTTGLFKTLSSMHMNWCQEHIGSNSANLKKEENQTRVEFAQEQQVLFERWCKSQNAKDLDDLKNLLLLEQFKHRVREGVATYLNEHKGLTLEKAAVLADEFSLTHKSTFPSKSTNTMPQNPPTNLEPGSGPTL